MSIKLAKGETIVRDYQYAGSAGGFGPTKSGTTKNLIVTNRRIIHRTVRKGLGSEQISNDEVPITDINNINSFYGQKSRTWAFWWGLAFEIIAVITAISGRSAGASVFAVIHALVGAGLFVV